MEEDKKGRSKQNGKPTPDNPVEIINKKVGKNLLKDVEYEFLEDNGVDYESLKNVLITLEQYKEYINLKGLADKLGYIKNKKTGLLEKRDIATPYEPYIPTSLAKEKIEEARKEYKQVLDSMERRISHTKDEHKIRSYYADFGVKRGRLEICEDLLERSREDEK